jgi:hypothetical protein
MHLKISADTEGDISSNATRRVCKLLGSKFLISKVSVENNYIAKRLMFPKPRERTSSRAAALEDWAAALPRRSWKANAGDRIVYTASIDLFDG